MKKDDCELNCIKSLEKETDLKLTALDQAVGLKLTALGEATDLKLTAINQATDLKLTALEKSIDLKDSTVEKSTQIWMAQIDERIKHGNAIRETLTDQANSFLPKVLYESDQIRVKDDIKFLREAKAKEEGKASQTSVMIAYALALLSLATAIVAIFI